MSSITHSKNSELKLELETVQAICKIIDSPRALTVFLLIEKSEWQQLIDLTIDPKDYEDPLRFAEDLQLLRPYLNLQIFHLTWIGDRLL